MDLGRTNENLSWTESTNRKQHLIFLITKHQHS